MLSNPHLRMNATTEAWLMNHSVVAFETKFYDYGRARNSADIAKYLP